MMGKRIETAIEAKGLYKTWGKVHALNGVDLKVGEGQVFGVLGPNGAGKSTMLRTISGLLNPTKGEIFVSNINVMKHRLQAQTNITYLPGDVRLYDNLSGWENLRFLGDLHTLPPARQSELMDRFKLSNNELGRKIRTYSSGMRQKVAIIATFQHDVPIYILDEPTEGLDPLMQAEFAQLIEEQAKAGKTILLSSHTLSEVERTCDHIAILRQGEIIFNGELKDLRKKAIRQLDVTFGKAVVIDWQKLKGVVSLSGTKTRHIVAFRGNPKPFIAKLAAHPVEDLNLSSASLDETFLNMYREEEDV
ncbi:MAG: ABC transporter ATP-binding protein [Candidatus Saccharimonadales bacterium]|nr:ABC transporter ATP-binding protein [Candidatus Saccharimonadales bacterium]